jgi:hypothetical protein
MTWEDGYCINDHPAPTDGSVTIYDSELECCKGAYVGQSSGACLAQLPSPPTASPFGVNGPDIWYPKPGVQWTDGYCVNDYPAPDEATLNGAHVYDSELECCKGFYGTQTSGKCLTYLPSPPTASPITAAGPDKWYKKADMTWDDGYCINDHPAPTDGSVTIYDSELECCKGAYVGQSSGACLAQLPSPPTASPAGPDSPFYPVWVGTGWGASYCDNDPAERPVGVDYAYASQEECCTKWFANQPSNTCMNHDPTYGSRSPTQAPIQ